MTGRRRGLGFAEPCFAGPGIDSGHHAAPRRHQRVSSRARGPLRRGTQARPVPHGDARPVRRVGARLPRGGAGARHPTGDDPSGRRPGGAAIAGAEERQGSHHGDATPGPCTCRHARPPRPCWLRPQERLANLRHGARARLRRRRSAGAQRRRHVRARSDGAHADASGRGGRPPARSCAARELRRAPVRLRALADVHGRAADAGGGWCASTPPTS